MKQFLLIFLILGGVSCLIAQAPYMRQYTVENGLPSSNIYAVLESKNGFMWFGTDKGLVRFDGYRFKVFDPTKVNGSTEIWGLKEDETGRIWCSTFNNALYFFEGQFYTAGHQEQSFPRKAETYFLNENGNDFVWTNEKSALFEIRTNDSIHLHPIHLPFDFIEEMLVQFYFLKKEADGTRWFAAYLINEVLVFKQKNQIFEKVNFNFLLPNAAYVPLILKDKSVLFFSDTAAVHFDFQHFKPVAIHEIFGEELKILGNYQFGKTGVFSTDKGYKVLDGNGQIQRGFDFLNELEMNAIYEDSKGNIWICTPMSGIYFLSKKAQTSITVSKLDKTSNSKITAMARDDNGIIWLGLNNGNLFKMSEDFSVSEIKIDFEGPGRKFRHRIKAIQKDGLGNLHLAYDSGILLVFPENSLNRSRFEIGSKAVNVDSFLAQKSIIYFDKNEKNGVWGIGLGSTKSYQITEENEVWMASSSGVYKIDLADNPPTFHRFNEKRTYAIAILQQTLWMGKKEGLYFKQKKNKLIPLQKDKNFTSSILDLATSTHEKLWVSVEGKGLFRYDGIKIDTIAEFFKNKMIISSLFSDEKSNLWMATNQGVCKIEVVSDSPFDYNLKRYSYAEGLPAREVNQVLVKDELIYVITQEGLTILDENQSADLEKNIPLYFTEIRVNNQPILVENKLELSHNQNNIEFEFAALSYQSLGEITYQYKMEGVDEKWQNTKEAEKKYNTLVPGNYVFRLKILDGFGNIAAEKKIELSILAIWWQRKTAYLLYFLFIGGIFFYIVLLYLKRKLAEQKTQQEIELNELKNHFFANITHEFRTPLTIILGMTEKLSEQGKDKDKLAALLIQKHSSKLLSLVNQILGLIKLQEGKLPQKMVQGDVLTVIKSSVESFQTVAEAKKITLKYTSELTELTIKFYPEELQTCLVNLLTNALKFTPTGGEISVHTDITNLPNGFAFDRKNTKKWFSLAASKKSVVKNKKHPFEKMLLLSVKDSGQGIGHQELYQVFDRFYSSNSTINSGIDSGTGIGLALTKELVEQMGGKISATSKLEGGSVFSINLPIVRKENTAKKEGNANFQPLPEKQIYQTEELVSIRSSAKQLPQLLIVEDERDMFLYLQSLLENQYQLHYAEDGQKGIDFALENVPDLILSDISMPKISGLELCEKLKNDTRTSHIPIILLTAKTEQSDKIRGLTRGADAYLTKPFDKQELFIRLEKLSELRQQLFQRYSKNDLPKPIGSSAKDFQLEDEFITQLRSFIIKNMEDEKLGVPKICQAMAMSRTQLHRKMVALTGASVSKFILQIRMKKAEKLLRTTNLNISEIAYQTGYSAKRFSSAFKTVFGKSPAAFRKIIKEE